MSRAEPNPEALSGALDRGLAILRHLSLHRKATPGELAHALGLSKSTTYRLVERLRDQGWLSGDEHGGPVRLGPASAQLAAAAAESNSLRDTAVPVIHDLMIATRETASLAVPSNLTMVFVHRERGPQPVGVSAELGTARPLHSTSVGRAFLAALSHEALAQVLDELITSPTSPIGTEDVPRLVDVIRETQDRGWSQDVREFNVSSACCGAAVLDHTGTPVAAISVAGVAERMIPEIETIGPVVASHAARISAQLGYLPG